MVLYTPEEADEPLIGDVNGDGQITIDDATMLQRHLAEFTNEDGSAIIDETDADLFKRCDVDGDGKLKIMDVTHIQRKVAEFE